jgi:hypothetical protein
MLNILHLEPDGDKSWEMVVKCFNSEGMRAVIVRTLDAIATANERNEEVDAVLVTKSVLADSQIGANDFILLIRRCWNFAKVPVILITDDPVEELANCQDFIQVPDNDETLFPHLRRLAGEKESQRSFVLT